MAAPPQTDFWAPRSKLWLAGWPLFSGASQIVRAAREFVCESRRKWPLTASRTAAARCSMLGAQRSSLVARRACLVVVDGAHPCRRRILMVDNSIGERASGRTIEAAHSERRHQIDSPFCSLLAHCVHFRQACELQTSKWAAAAAAAAKWIRPDLARSLSQSGGRLFASLAPRLLVIMMANELLSHALACRRKRLLSRSFNQRRAAPGT